MEIVAVVTDKETQRPVAEPGSKPPKSPFEYKKMTHSVVHFNQKPGQKSLLNVPLDKWCICILHMQLRIVSMLFTETVLTDATLGRKLTKKEKKKAGLSGATSQTEDLSLAGAVWLLLLAAGIHVKLFTPPKANINTYYHSISKHSFEGGDAMKLMVI